MTHQRLCWLGTVDTVNPVLALTGPSNWKVSPLGLSTFEAALNRHPLSEACPDL